MDTAVPGNAVFPEPESRINNAWASTVPQITSNYYKLDFSLMAGRQFLRNFTGHPTCPASQWQKVFDLVTGGVVSLDSAFFEEQHLTMFVSQPFVDGRADGAVFLNEDNDKILRHIDCYYPRSIYISKQVDKCRDQWKFRIPWKSAKSCEWNITQEETHLIYRGRVIVHNQEWVGTDQWRIIRAVLRVKLRFQRFVTVESANISITNQNIQRFAITKQLVALELGQPALIELGTLLFWPFKLYNFSMNVYPLSKIGAVVYSKDDCVSAQGSDCRQYFRTSLTLTPETCTLDGTYSLNFTVNCGEDVLLANNCSLSPSIPSDYVASVEYRLTSENFCAEITVDVGIVGNIRSYDNQTFDSFPSKPSFIIGRRLYFLVKVNSDLNEPKTNGQPDPDLYTATGSGIVVTFGKVDLVTVTIKFSNGTLQRIWEKKRALVTADFVSRGQADFKTLCQEHKTKSPGPALVGNSVGFSFVFTKELASISRSQKITVSIQAEVQATYNNLSKKRQGTSGDDTNVYSVNSEIDGNDGTDTTSPTTSTTGPTTSTTGPTTSTTGPTTTSTTTTPSTTSTPTSTESSNAVALFASLMMILIALI
jgi:hypothetical protein